MLTYYLPANYNYVREIPHNYNVNYKNIQKKMSTYLHILIVNTYKVSKCKYSVQ